MTKKIYFINLLLVMTSVANAQTVQIPKIEYEYTTVNQTCDVQNFAQNQPPLTQIPQVQCFTGIPDFSALGKDGWELVNTISGYTIVNLNAGQFVGPNWIVRYNQTFIFKRAKPINEQQFYAQLNTIAQTKIDSSMSSIKRFIISTLNQSTRELFSTEYAEAMKEAILTQIRTEMRATVDSVINSTRQH